MINRLSQYRAFRIAVIIIANVIYAATVHFFLVPGNLITAGVTGVGLIVLKFAAIPLSATVLALNVALLIVGRIFLGREFAATTILATLVYPIALGFFERVAPGCVITDDIILCTIYTGIGTGLALGLSFRMGSSTGGLDIIPLIVERYFHVPASAGVNIVDTIVVLAQAVIASMEQILYGFVLIIIYTVIIDKISILGKSQAQIMVISEKSEEIKKVILDDISRGVTVLDGSGGYFGRDVDILLSVMSKREVTKVVNIIHSIDKDCFLIINRVNEVHGNGFI